VDRPSPRVRFQFSTELRNKRSRDKSPHYRVDVPRSETGYAATIRRVARAFAKKWRVHPFEFGHSRHTN